MPSLNPLTALPRSVPTFPSFFVPNISTTTSKTISQCPKLNPPMSILLACYPCSGTTRAASLIRFAAFPWSTLSAPWSRPADHVQMKMVHLLPAIRSRVELRLESARADCALFAGAIAATLFLRQLRRKQHHFRQQRAVLLPAVRQG